MKQQDQKNDGGGCLDENAFWHSSEEADEKDGCQHKLDLIEPKENQAADAEAQFEGDAGGGELERSLQKRKAADQAEPSERDNDL